MSSHIVFFITFSLFNFGLCTINVVAGETTTNHPTYPAILAFGDSILDTGNNNYLETLSKCNFPPYGKDFPGGQPTGRFCDGKVPSDLIAKALGIKELLPAYLDPNLRNEDLPTGVCFASGGSGLDPLTARIQSVLAMPDQLSYFKEYIGKLKAGVGDDKANSILNNGLYLISAGNNDIAFTYLTAHLRFLPFLIYVNELLKSTSSFIQELYGLGARRIAVLSTLPLGCLPSARTLAGGFFRVCSDIINQAAQLFNTQLKSTLDSLQDNFPGATLIFVDVYSPLLDLINNPQKYGFQVVDKGCCLAGSNFYALLCNPIGANQCSSTSSYVFWDGAHPTEAAYSAIVSQILPTITN